MGLRAGVAKVDITPPVGIPMGGFAARPARSQGIHDPLYAKALALSTEDESAISIMVDALSIPKKIVDKVRESIRGLTGVGEEAVMIAASHTHSGPATIGIWSDLDEPFIDAYLRVLEKSLTGLAYMAWRGMSDATMGGGKGEATISYNRREKGGPIDTEVGIIRIDDAEGSPQAAVVNYACHPVVLGPQNLLISADYPGYVIKVLERAKGRGFVCMFTNGADGDINPLSHKGWRDLRFDPPGTFRDAERLGSIIAGEALKTLEHTRTSSEVQIQASSETRRLLIPKASIVGAEQQLENMQKKIAELRANGAVPARHEAMLRYLTRNIDYLKKETDRDREVTLEVQVIRIDDVALVAVPGELFVEIGKEIKDQSEVEHTLVVGYANGYIGYIPTSKAFEKGGAARRNWWNKATPEEERFVKESSLKQLKAMQKAVNPR